MTGQDSYLLTLVTKAGQGPVTLLDNLFFLISFSPLLLHLSTLLILPRSSFSGEEPSPYLFIKLITSEPVTNRYLQFRTLIKPQTGRTTIE